MITICSVSGCGRRHSSHGLCQTHRKYQRRGLPLKPIPPNFIGENNPKWKGGTMEDGHGRTLILRPDHPYPNFLKKYVYRYRLVVEESIGRLLLPTEIVHHINGDVSDDRIENLEVMSQSKHLKTHLPAMLAKQGKRHAANY